MRLIPTCAICVIAAAAAIGPASAPALAASSDYFLKLGPVKPVLSDVEGGEESAAREGHQEPIEILSYSFAASRKGWDGTVKGGNAAENSGTAKFGAISGVRRDDTIANPAGKVSMQDISAPSMTSGPAKSTPLTSGRVGDTSPAADAGPGQPAATSAAPKAVSHDLRTNVVARMAAPPAAPPAAGSITVDGNFPGCAVGTSYADAVLQVPGARYLLTDVQITSCPAPVSAARSSLAGEYLRGSLSLNYKKVTVRGWDPAKKEE